jgi:hypothetical protein
MTTERKQELTALAARLAENWDRVKTRYRIHRFTATMKLNPDRKKGKPTPAGSPTFNRDDMPDFAEYRRAIVALGQVDADPNVAALVAETKDFPVNAHENGSLWDMIVERLHPKAARDDRVTAGRDKSLSARSLKSLAFMKDIQDIMAKMKKPSIRAACSRYATKHGKDAEKTRNRYREAKKRSKA